MKGGRLVNGGEDEELENFITSYLAIWNALYHVFLFQCYSREYIE